MARRKREPTEIEPFDVLDRLDRLFDEWARAFSMRRPFGFARELLDEALIRVDEIREKDALVVRAELPGIDPDEDVELTVSDGRLHISAERREESETEGEGYRRREIRSGSFHRSLPLPANVSEKDITARYADGILDIRIPVPEVAEGRKIPIDRN